MTPLSEIVFDPLVAAPLWWALAIGGAMFALVSLLRNWKSGAFRAIAVAALLLMLAGPLKREAETTPLNDLVIVLVDESASQTLNGRAAATARAADGLKEKLGAFANVDVEFVAYGGVEETRTVEALRQALADAPGQRLAGVFILTDGQSADAADADAVRVEGAPVHLLTTGAPDETDRKLTLINAPRYGIVRQPVRVSFRIDDLGPDENPLGKEGSAEVVLRVDGEEVLRQPVPIGSEAGFDAPLPRPGETVVELEVEARAGELTTRNNIAVLPITAVRDRLRVLLISGEPHPGERVWRNLLKSDPAVDLVHFTILRPIDKNDGTAVDELALIPFPQDELFIDKLGEFDLLIFDRYAYRGVLSSLHFDNIARFVDNGGGVLIASGPEFFGPLSLAARRNLAFILPALPAAAAREGAYRAAVADLGRRHPVTADLPDQDIWGRWLRAMPVRQERGATLLSGPDDTPLLILDRVGEGRVGLLLSDHVWLWARGFDGGGPHAELLRRIAHWLMKEPELEEEALRLREDSGALVVERRTLAETAPAVTITAPDGVESSVDLSGEAPGLYAARIADAPRGLYRARSGDLFAVGFVGVEAPPEFENVLSTTTALQPLAEASGGGVFAIRSERGVTTPDLRRVRAGAAEQAGTNWAGLVERRAERVEKVRDAPIAPPLAWLLLAGLSLVAAWAIEGGRLSRFRVNRDQP